jgi:hypothetical protein
MSINKRDWLYYLLNFQFITDDKGIYQRIRDMIYNGIDFDDVKIYKDIMFIKPISDKSEVYSFKEWARDKKINQILAF